MKFKTAIFLIIISFSTMRAQPLLVVPGKSSEVNSQVNVKNYEYIKGELQNYQSDVNEIKRKKTEVYDKSLQNEGVYTSVSYSLISPSFDADSLRGLNQESLGLTVSAGYIYAPPQEWGVGIGVGLFQNSKTDRSLPDFVAIKPNLHLIYSFDSRFYATGGIFTLNWQDEKYKNFVSYIGSDYQLGYKVSKRMNLRFGASFIKIIGEFTDVSNKKVSSLVSIKGIESQLIFLF